MKAWPPALKPFVYNIDYGVVARPHKPGRYRTAHHSNPWRISGLDRPFKTHQDAINEAVRLVRQEIP